MVTINYLLGNLGKKHLNTVGVVDLGGESVQMAYAISETEAVKAPRATDGEDSYVKELFLKGTTYYLYVHSYLQYGLLAARADILKIGEGSGNPFILNGYHVVHFSKMQWLFLVGIHLEDSCCKRSLKWWSSIASQLLGRTDNEIKNFWNTHFKKRLLRMGLDPATHAQPAPSSAGSDSSSSNDLDESSGTSLKLLLDSPTDEIGFLQGQLGSFSMFSSELTATSSLKSQW